MIGELDRSGLKSNWECFLFFQLKKVDFQAEGHRIIFSPTKGSLWTNRFREPQLEEEGSPDHTGSPSS